jgi:predicted metal-dependent hydrolase
MSTKRNRIADRTATAPSGGGEKEYWGYFERFNRQLFFEAHEVLETVWLADRTAPDAAFYKGLIQLAGAFVHLQRNRLRPAAALFDLAEANLRTYLPNHKRLDVSAVLELIRSWRAALNEGRFEKNPLAGKPAPRLFPGV